MRTSCAHSFASRGDTWFPGTWGGKRPAYRVSRAGPGPAGGPGSQSRMISAPLAMTAAAPATWITRPNGVLKKGCRRMTGVATTRLVATTARTVLPVGEPRNMTVWSMPASTARPSVRRTRSNSADGFTQRPYRGYLEASLDVRGPVADAADRLDQVLVRRAELGAQAPDVDVHRPGAAVEVVAPDLPHEGRPGEDAPRVLGQEPQQLELLERQVKRRAVEAHAEGARVQRKRHEPGRRVIDAVRAAQ